MRLVIFDLDGTLLNTIADLAASANYALEQCGYPTHAESEYKYFVGNGVDVMIERALPSDARQPESIEKVKSFFIPFYTEHASHFTKPYDGLIPLLENLQSKGIKLAVATNKYQAGADLVIAEYFPTIQFDVVLGQRDGIPVKPHPQVVYDILETLDVQKKDAVYIGDSDVDMLTAQNAHVRSIGVTWGFRTSHELIVHGAGQIVNNAQELEAVLLDAKN